MKGVDIYNSMRPDKAITIGRIPGRKSIAITIADEGRNRIIAYIKKEEDAQALIDRISEVCDAKRIKEED